MVKRFGLSAAAQRSRACRFPTKSQVKEGDPVIRWVREKAPGQGN